MLYMGKKRQETDRHKDKTKSFRFRKEINELLEQLAEDQRRTQTTIVEMALEEFGQKNSKWPPKKGDHS